ncbi:Camp-specific 3' [Globisporangium polare]
MSDDDDREAEMAASPATAAVTTAAKGRGKRLTDSERMEIIARLEDKTTPLSRAKCARIYGVTPAAISKLMKVSETVKKRYADAGVEAGHLRDKRQRGGFSKNMCFEDELFKWICSIRARRIPLLVAHVQQKAKLLAAKHQMNDDFKASNGWYYRFCARYGLAPGSLHAGGGGVSSNANTTVATPSTSLIDKSASSDSDDSNQLNNNIKALSSVKIKRTPVAKAVWSDDPATAEKVGSLQDQVKKFGSEFVYSLSEARLFYKLLPHQLIPTNQQNDSNHSNGVESEQGGSQTKGNTERVMVLVCANGTGTHKIPLLVVGKQARPVCFAVNQHSTTSHFTPNSSHNNLPIQSAVMQVGATKYYSQRDVWCDNQTFQYWCTSVFAPAVQARTTQPVLLLMDNPGGSLDEFQFDNIATYFLPTRAGSLNAALQSGAASSTHAQFQPLQHGVVRELKRRYKIALFHEALSFLEKGDEERYRLLQRALNRPQGTTGIAFGRLPHVADAMALLEEVWAAIPVNLLRTGWVRSNLYAEGFPELQQADREQQRPDISDDTVVLELSSMLRHVKSVDELQGLPKEIRLWMYADDDASERMQQELLHDVQRLLQEEEDGVRVTTHATAAVVTPPVPAAAPLVPVNTNGAMDSSPIYEQQHQQQHGVFTSLMHSTGMQHQPHPVYGDFSMHQHQQSMGYGYSLPHQQQLHQQPLPAHFNRQLHPPPQQQQHHLHQQPHLQPHQQHTDSPMALRESRKAVSFALRALANAEEALDNADVAEHFGDEVTSEAIKAVGAVLRRLRRIHRGKQSTLPPRSAAANAQASGGSAPPAAATSSAHDVATSTHAYFYGDAK